MTDHSGTPSASPRERDEAIYIEFEDVGSETRVQVTRGYRGQVLLNFHWTGGLTLQSQSQLNAMLRHLLATASRSGIPTGSQSSATDEESAELLASLAQDVEHGYVSSNRAIRVGIADALRSLASRLREGSPS